MTDPTNLRVSPMPPAAPAAPAIPNLNPDDLETPQALSALDAIDDYIAPRGPGTIFLDVARKRIQALHYYLHELQRGLDDFARTGRVPE